MDVSKVRAKYFFLIHLKPPFVPFRTFKKSTKTVDRFFEVYLDIVHIPILLIISAAVVFNAKKKISDVRFMTLGSRCSYFEEEISAVN